MMGNYDKECCEAVEKFSGLMRKVLYLRRGKGHWGELSTGKLATGAVNHMYQMRGALDRLLDKPGLGDEADLGIFLDNGVDIANYVMMIADNLGLLDRPDLL